MLFITRTLSNYYQSRIHPTCWSTNMVSRFKNTISTGLRCLSHFNSTFLSTNHTSCHGRIDINTYIYIYIHNLYIPGKPWTHFFVIVWSHLCESCYGFLQPFSNKILKNTVLLRVGLQCSFDSAFFCHYGQKQYFAKKKLVVIALSHDDQKIVHFWLSRYILL